MKHRKMRTFLLCPTFPIFCSFCWFLNSATGDKITFPQRIVNHRDPSSGLISADFPILEPLKLTFPITIIHLIVARSGFSSAASTLRDIINVNYEPIRCWFACWMHRAKKNFLLYPFFIVFFNGFSIVKCQLCNWKCNAIAFELHRIWSIIFETNNTY